MTEREGARPCGDQDPPKHTSAGLSIDLPDSVLDALADRVAARMAPPVEPYLDADQAAEYLGCLRPTAKKPAGRIYELVEGGSLACFRDGRRMLFKRADLDACLERIEASE